MIQKLLKKLALRRIQCAPAFYPMLSDQISQSKINRHISKSRNSAVLNSTHNYCHGGSRILGLHRECVEHTRALARRRPLRTNTENIMHRCSWEQYEICLASCEPFPNESRGGEWCSQWIKETWTVARERQHEYTLEQRALPSELPNLPTLPSIVATCFLSCTAVLSVRRNGAHLKAGSWGYFRVGLKSYWIDEISFSCKVFSTKTSRTG